MLCTLLAVVACGDAPPRALTPTTPPSPPDELPDGERYTLRRCAEGFLADARPLEPWRHAATSRALTAVASPRLAMSDVLTSSAQGALLVAHVRYGAAYTSLRDEWVELLIDDCRGELRLVARVLTSSTGVAAFQIQPEDTPFLGEYDVVARVVGDGATTRATLRVLPPATQLVVVGFDGTLTTDGVERVRDRLSELFEPLGADYVPPARAGAARLSRLRHEEQGYEVVYLTGRPPSLAARTRQWLADEGFAPGTVRVADARRQVATGEAQAAYKRSELARYRALGFTIRHAYGSGADDLSVYRDVGVPASQRFMLGERVEGGEAVWLGETFESHLESSADDAAAEQPFVR